MARAPLRRTLYTPSTRSSPPPRQRHQKSEHHQEHISEEREENTGGNEIDLTLQAGPKARKTRSFLDDFSADPPGYPRLPKVLLLGQVSRRFTSRRRFEGRNGGRRATGRHTARAQKAENKRRPATSRTQNPGAAGSGRSWERHPQELRRGFLPPPPDPPSPFLAKRLRENTSKSGD